MNYLKRKLFHELPLPLPVAPLPVSVLPPPPPPPLLPPPILTTKHKPGIVQLKYVWIMPLKAPRFQGLCAAVETLISGNVAT